MLKQMASPLRVSLKRMASPCGLQKSYHYWSRHLAHANHGDDDCSARARANLGGGEANKGKEELGLATGFGGVLRQGNRRGRGENGKGPHIDAVAELDGGEEAAVVVDRKRPTAAFQGQRRRGRQRQGSPPSLRWCS